MAVAIDVSGIDKIHPTVEGVVQRADRRIVINSTPVTAQLSCTKGDSRPPAIRSAQKHGISSQPCCLRGDLSGLVSVSNGCADRKTSGMARRPIVHKASRTPLAVECLLSAHSCRLWGPGERQLYARFGLWALATRICVSSFCRSKGRRFACHSLLRRVGMAQCSEKCIAIRLTSFAAGGGLDATGTFVAFKFWT